MAENFALASADREVVYGTPAGGDPRERVTTLIQRAQRDFRTVMATEGTLREKQFEDLRFAAAEQWHPTDVQQRFLDQRPCLTINRLSQFVRNVINSIRQAKPSVQVHPVDSGADVDTAEVFQGIIRHIENQSDALSAYITAAESQARIGVGYWHIVAEFLDDVAFQQELKIKRIRNSFSVVMDPACQEPDGSDARYCFIVEDMPKNLYKQRFGDASLQGLTSFNLGPERTQDWMPEGKIRVAAYWYVDVTDDEVLLVRWPTEQEEVVLKSVYDQWPEEQRNVATIAKRRPYENRQVKCALINAVEILEGNEDKTAGADWPGKWIPIVRVVGEEIDMNGMVDYRGMIRDAKDPQRMYNYQNSALAEALALAPKAPFIGTEGQFEGHEDKWRQANRRNFPYLEVKPISIMGTLAPYPVRNEVGANISSIVAAIQQADNDLKATTGLYDASLGNRKDDQQSGKAITALQQQGEMANSNFLDNLSRGIRHTGRLLIDLIPHYYDAPRVIRIVGTDNKPKSVMVHAGQPQNVPDQLPEGVKNVYDLSAGRYDIVVETGPQSPTKRQEAVAQLTAIMQAAPQLTPALADLAVGNMDWDGAQNAEKRLQKMLPPQLQEQDGPGGEIPPQVQAQMAQVAQQMQGMGMQLQETQAELAEAQKALAAKQIESQANIALKQMEIASRERMEQLKIQSTERLAQMKMRNDLIVARAEAQHDAQHDRLGRVMDHAHDRELSAQEHLQNLREAEHAQAITPVESVADGDEPEDTTAQ